MDKWYMERIDRLEDRIYDLETQILMDRYNSSMKKHNIIIGGCLVMSFLLALALLYIIY